MNEVNELLTLSKKGATAKGINCSLTTMINGEHFLAVIIGKQDSDSHLVSLAVRMQSTERWTGPGERFQILRVNLAARTCRRQHGLRRSKKWPSSKIEITENLNATLPLSLSVFFKTARLT